MSHENNTGTKSMKNDLIYIPPLFNKLFIAAYPDVYEWYQSTPKEDININNEIKKLPEEEQEYMLTNDEKKRELYRSLIEQFKRDIGELETKIIQL